MPELDSVRGVAVLLVLLFHAFGMSTGVSGAPPWGKLFLGFAAAGWTGVHLFFVLSGFLITGILLSSRDRTDYYQRFYKRRALRILPACYLVLFLLAIFSRSGLVDRHVSWSFLGLGFVFLANVTNLFGVTAQYTVLWSLAVEEHFYLFWPAVVKRLSRSHLAIIAGGIFLLCPLLRSFYFLHKFQYGAGYTWLNADGLACGALLAIGARGLLARRKPMALAGGLLILLSLGGFLAARTLGIAYARTFAGGTFRLTLLSILFAGFIAVALALGSSAHCRLVDIKVLKFLGDISYGLYLIHMMVFDFVDKAAQTYFPAYHDPTFTWLILRAAIGISLSISLAYLSRWTFEEWFLRLGRGAPAAKVLVAPQPVEMAS